MLACSFEQLLALAAARSAVRAQGILQLAQAITAGQGEPKEWRKVQEKLIELSQM